MGGTQSVAEEKKSEVLESIEWRKGNPFIMNDYKKDPTDMGTSSHLFSLSLTLDLTLSLSLSFRKRFRCTF